MDGLTQSYSLEQLFTQRAFSQLGFVDLVSTLGAERGLPFLDTFIMVEIRSTTRCE
ncbi:hypothetical protein M404DRAFT_1002496 [Pisolithus tinctorius Marx 270]|uniref:Uncharacterized protein n=1 Tax=Pisolithus tinctorius Marx 270 TaxID=870435 RepID=A0A0C3P442_PISTI|nr:hypothetical protein M404DRAFT_1002496 [Pisolithus tinctorius Marx 270]